MCQLAWSGRVPSGVNLFINNSDVLAVLEGLGMKHLPSSYAGPALVIEESIIDDYLLLSNYPFDFLNATCHIRFFPMKKKYSPVNHNCVGH